MEKGAVGVADSRCAKTPGIAVGPGKRSPGKGTFSLIPILSNRFTMIYQTFLLHRGIVRGPPIIGENSNLEKGAHSVLEEHFLKVLTGQVVRYKT